MSVDIERLLKRIVEEVFDVAESVDYIQDPNHADDWLASIASSRDDSRRIELRATYESFIARIPALDVGTIVFEYGDGEPEKESTLRELAQAMRSYRYDGGSVEIKPGLLGIRKRVFVTIEHNEKRWVLGKHSSSVGELA